jgi:hypothetical protein
MMAMTRFRTLMSRGGLLSPIIALRLPSMRRPHPCLEFGVGLCHLGYVVAVGGSAGSFVPVAAVVAVSPSRHLVEEVNGGEGCHFRVVESLGDISKDIRYLP